MLEYLDFDKNKVYKQQVTKIIEIAENTYAYNQMITQNSCLTSLLNLLTLRFSRLLFL